VAGVEFAVGQYLAASREGGSACAAARLVTQLVPRGPNVVADATRAFPDVALSRGVADFDQGRLADTISLMTENLATLASIFGRQAAGPLTDCLESSDACVRGLAVYMLGLREVLGPLTLVHANSMMLTDPEPVVRACAATGLSRWTSLPRVQEAAIERLADWADTLEFDWRRAAAETQTSQQDALLTLFAPFVSAWLCSEIWPRVIAQVGAGGAAPKR
jgi:hypothetical protein